MNDINPTKRIAIPRLLSLATLATSLLVSLAQAAAPGIKSSGNTFRLRAEESFISQPDGNTVYSWGYGCENTDGITFAPEMPNRNCPSMQIPGPTLIVTEGQQFTVTLTNGLPAAAGNTSILFPGMRVVGTSGGATGLMTEEAVPGAP